MRLYLLEPTLVRNRIVLFGLDGAGRTVCVRVLGFKWQTFTEPKTAKLETQDEALGWMRKTVVPHLKEGTVSAGCMPKTYLAGKGQRDMRWMGRMLHETPHMMRQTAADLQKEGVRVYNHNLDPILMFLHQSGLRCHSYVEINNEKVTTLKWSACDAEYTAEARDLGLVADASSLAPPPMTILSFDLETDGLSPDKGDEIRMIAIHLETSDATGGAAASRSILLSRHALDTDNADYEIRVHDDEMSLIKAFACIVLESRAVFVTGWNISGFDLMFLVERCRRLTGSLRALQSLSWLTILGINAESKTLSTAAYGHNAMTILRDAPGPQWIDGLILARKMQEKQPSYTLRALAIWAKAGEKDDVTYPEMVEAFETRDVVKLRRVADYCVKVGQSFSHSVILVLVVGIAMHVVGMVLGPGTPCALSPCL